MYRPTTKTVYRLQGGPKTVTISVYLYTKLSSRYSCHCESYLCDKKHRNISKMSYLYDTLLNCRPTTSITVLEKWLILS